jgi:hypothetical protein
VHPVSVLILFFLIFVVAEKVSSLPHASLRWLTQPTVLIVAHFRSERGQYLLDTHVTVPASHGRDLVGVDIASFRIDAGHIDLRGETNFWRDSWIPLGTTNSEFIEATVVLSL